MITSDEYIVKACETADVFEVRYVEKKPLPKRLGIVVQEAMYAGLPVVSTDHGGQVDLLEDGRNGLLVNVGDVEAMTAAIARLHEAPEVREVMSRNNREDLERLYIPVNCLEYTDLFWEIAPKKSSGAT